VTVFNVAFPAALRQVTAPVVRAYLTFRSPVPYVRSLPTVAGADDNKSSVNLLGAIKLSASLSFRRVGNEEHAYDNNAELLGATGSPFKEKGWVANPFLREAVDGPFRLDEEGTEYHFSAEAKGEEGEEEEFDLERDGPLQTIT